MKLKTFILVFIIGLLFSGCRAYTGISQAETEDTFYVLAMGNEVLKCKRFGMRMVCVRLNVEEVDMATYRASQRRHQQRMERNSQENRTQTSDRNFSPVPQQQEETRTRLRSRANQEMN